MASRQIVQSASPLAGPASFWKSRIAQSRAPNTRLNAPRLWIWEISEILKPVIVVSQIDNIAEISRNSLGG
jgi:hypothetical protein